MHIHFYIFIYVREKYRDVKMKSIYKRENLEARVTRLVPMSSSDNELLLAIDRHAVSQEKNVYVTMKKR